jgi:hypothetical protein
MSERCDVAGCPRPEEHFPVVQLVLPLELRLCAELMRGAADGCERAGFTAIVIDLPGHGNGRIYAARLKVQ